MKKTIMLIVPLLMLAFYGTSQVTTAQAVCTAGPVLPNCISGKRVTIVNGPNTVAPPDICIKAGETLSFKVQPNGSTARVVGKDGGWPNGSGTSFDLVVPNVAKTYAYNVHFEDGTCMDPRIVVTH